MLVKKTHCVSFFMLEQITRYDLPEIVMDIVDNIGIDAFKESNYIDDIN